VSKITVLITGSSRGIGRAAAEEFNKNGFNIILNCSKSVDELDETVTHLKETNPNVIGIVADVSDFESALDMFRTANTRFGGVDILINNAGIAHMGLFSEMSPAEWQRVMDVNINSTLNCTKLALPYMLERKSGCIVNISSVWGLTGASCEAVYSLTKGAINAFTKALAKELAPSGIRVNAVACGVIDTVMNSTLDAAEKASLAESIPMGRFGTSLEIADLVCFLCSNKAEYITGQVIAADGGWI